MNILVLRTWYLRTLVAPGGIHHALSLVRIVKHINIVSRISQIYGTICHRNVARVSQGVARVSRSCHGVSRGVSQTAEVSRGGVTGVSRGCHRGVTGVSSTPTSKGPGRYRGEAGDVLCCRRRVAEMSQSVAGVSQNVVEVSRRCRGSVAEVSQGVAEAS